MNHAVACMSSLCRMVTGSHPEEGLAKFGYRPDMQVEHFKNLLLWFGYLMEPVVKIW